MFEWKASSGFWTCDWVEVAEMSGILLSFAWVKALCVWLCAGVVISEVVMMPFLEGDVLLLWLVDQERLSITPSAKMSTLSCSNFFWQSPSTGWTLFIGDTKGFCFRKNEGELHYFWVLVHFCCWLLSIVSSFCWLTAQTPDANRKLQIWIGGHWTARQVQRKTIVLWCDCAD